MKSSVLIALIFSALLAIFLPVTPKAEAYAGRRIIYRQANYSTYPRTTNIRYNRSSAYPSRHCVYFASNGRCQYSTTQYNNVRTTRSNYFTGPYLYVDPIAVSPRTKHTRPYYIRSSNYYYNELPRTTTYDEHYRRSHNRRSSYGNPHYNR